MKVAILGFAFFCATVVALIIFNIGYIFVDITSAFFRNENIYAFPLSTVMPTLVFISIFEWPIVAVVTLPLVLLAGMYQRWSKTSSVIAYSVTGGVIATVAMVIASLTIFRWLARGSEWPSPAFLIVMLPFAILGGVVGAILFRFIQFQQL